MFITTHAVRTHAVCTKLKKSCQFKLQNQIQTSLPILILYTLINRALPFHHYAKYYSFLPRSIQIKINNYHKDADKIAGLLGKQLLSDGLKKFGIQQNGLQELKYKKNHRPYLEKFPRIDFNISHSGSLVVCALGKDIRVGIDVEKRDSINLANFKTQFSKDQWEELNYSIHPKNLFYKYWVQKESLIKADGSEVPTQFSDIDIQSNRAILNNDTWYLTSVFIEPDHETWLAADALSEIEIDRMHY